MRVHSSVCVSVCPGASPGAHFPHPCRQGCARQGPGLGGERRWTRVTGMGLLGLGSQAGRWRDQQKAETNKACNNRYRAAGPWPLVAVGWGAVTDETSCCWQTLRKQVGSPTREEGQALRGPPSKISAGIQRAAPGQRGCPCIHGPAQQGQAGREKGRGRLRGARASREHLSETLEEPHPGHSPNPQANPLLWPPSSKWGQGGVVGGHTWEVVKPG